MTETAVDYKQLIVISIEYNVICSLAGLPVVPLDKL